MAPGIIVLAKSKIGLKQLEIANDRQAVRKRLIKTIKVMMDLGLLPHKGSLSP